MNVTFWGVRGSTPAPGPAMVRYGGNTSCVSVRTKAGALLLLDCGTGARNLGHVLLAEPEPAPFRGRGQAAVLLSHTHWDHIQGFPFFGPLYVPGNAFRIFGPAQSSELLEGILEGQMAPQYFPVQTLKNMGARIDISAVVVGTPFEVMGCRVTATWNPHGRSRALAFRIEDGDTTLVYASDAGYSTDGPAPEALSLYAGADLLIHDSTYTAEDRARPGNQGLASVDDAVAVAVAAGVRRLALFHYAEDYTDTDVDRLIASAHDQIRRRGVALELIGASEGLTLTI